MSPGNEEPKLKAALAAVWKQSLPVILERVGVLEDYAETGGRDSGSNALRAEAKSAAHKLSGSLGMFGVLEASETARQIEEILEQESGSESPRLRELTKKLAALVRSADRQ